MTITEQNALCNDEIRLVDRFWDFWVRLANDDAISQFVIMKDSAATGKTTDEIAVVFFDAEKIDRFMDVLKMSYR